MANGRRQVNKRLALFIALPFGLLGSLSRVEAQQGQRVYRVGLLSLGSRPGRTRDVAELPRRHAGVGLHQGRNLSVALGFAEGRAERLPALVADQVRAKVDVIVTTSTQETQAARNATSTIPIVMTLVPDPVEQGSDRQSSATRRQHYRPDNHRARHESETPGAIARSPSLGVPLCGSNLRCDKPIPGRFGRNWMRPRDGLTLRLHTLEEFTDPTKSTRCSARRRTTVQRGIHCSPGGPHLRPSSETSSIRP